MTGKHDFAGAKLAILVGSDILLLRRDDIPSIPWLGAVDLPGGENEPGESPLDCALRETLEEISISVPPEAVIWRGEFDGVLPGQGRTWFLVARIDQALADKMVLGDEGQAAWQEPVSKFLSRNDAVPHFQERLKVFIDEIGL